MFKFLKKKKKPLSYVEAHNKAFKLFQKAALIMIWAAVFNVFGLFISIIQVISSSGELVSKFADGSFLYNNTLYAGSTFQYSLCYASNSFIFRLLETLTFNPYSSAQTLPTSWFYALIIIISLIFSSITAYLSVQARNGKFYALLASAIFYGVDTLMIIDCYLIGEDLSNIWIMIGVHVIILIFIFIAIFEYVRLFEIEKLHEKQISLLNKEQSEIVIGGE